jgi:LytS/YehU family sensor histidine kinase
MHRDVEAADRMLARLSDLLRMAIETAGAQEVALRREIEFVRGYLEIQRVRFGARLEVRLDMAPEVLDAAVPSLVLQPLVENAIRHGIAPRASGGRVEVRAERAGARLRLEVLDDGAGTRGGGAAGAGASAGPSTGVGLANTRARLEQLYGARQRFAAQDRESGGFAVTIELPFRAVEEPRSPDAAAAGAAS